MFNLNLSPEVQNILSVQGIYAEEDVLYALEQYKFWTNDEILNLFDDDNSYCFLDPQLNYSEFKDIQEQYGVIIKSLNSRTLVVYIPIFTPELPPSFDLALSSFSIERCYITRYNYDCIRRDKRVEYNPDILIKKIILDAINLHATDVHLTVEHVNNEVRYPVLYRRDGVMYTLDSYRLDKQLNESLVSKLIDKKTSKNSLDLGIAAGVVANSSNLFGTNDVELRISANKVLDGYRCVIRIQQKKTVSLKIEELGFAPSVLHDIELLANKKSGVTLITGAIRTGKNTTAFAMANKMIQDPISIVSYDSPVEVLMPFAQVDYQEDSKRLLSLVRLTKKQDVDVAFLNEIPTKEVAFAVSDLAESSIYVITTMHLDRLWQLPYRLYDYYGESYKNIISQINGVLNQKMFGVQCPHCREEKLLSELKSEPIYKLLSSKGVNSYFVTKGCKYCRDEITGSSGFIIGRNQPYAEHLIFTEEIKEHLLRCEHTWDMELYLKAKIREKAQALEDYMVDGVKSGDLNVESLEYIL